MEELSLLKKLGRVDAPPGFEQKIMAQISLRKRRQVRIRRLSYSFAGAFSALAVLVVVLNFFILPQRPGQAPSVSSLTEESLSDRAKSFPAKPEMRRETRMSRFIPIIESVDFSGEVRSLRSGPPTVYILEQVSDTTDTRIKY